MSETVILDESGNPALKPFNRLRSAFTLRDGIFTPEERLRFSETVKIIYKNPDPLKERLLASEKDWIAYSDVTDDSCEGAPVLYPCDPVSLTRQIAERIREDLKYLSRDTFPPLSHKNAADRFPGVHFAGDPDLFYIHNEAIILPGSVLNAQSGPLVIDSGCKITPFTYIEGPFYGGKEAMIDNARITGGTVIGNFCRAGGEIENSIMNDFSNKHHEGFLGHSVVGSWVNIGALATTSDLKNNYGEIRLFMESHEIRTGSIKFGSLIGDHVKIAIGTMLNTGTVIDAGCNVFGGTPGKYLPPFSWGLSGEIYKKDRFLSDAEKIMSRRKQLPGKNFSALLDIIYKEIRKTAAHEYKP